MFKMFVRPHDEVLNLTWITDSVPPSLGHLPAESRALKRYENIPTDVSHNQNGHWLLSNCNRGIISYADPEGNVPGQNFVPLPAMNTSEADVSVVSFSASRVSYSNPVDDPVFAAHRPVSDVSTFGVNNSVYESDWPVSAMGCWMQVRPSIRTGKATR
jgi:hypothetical protein